MTVAEPFLQQFEEIAWIDGAGPRPDLALFACKRCGASIAEQRISGDPQYLNRLRHADWHEEAQ